MSRELKTLKRTGSRNVEMFVTKYWGGKNGTCLQLTATQEEGLTGYVQINGNDLKKINKLWNKYCEGGKR